LENVWGTHSFGETLFCPYYVKARERFGSRIMARRRINQSIIIVTNIREREKRKGKAVKQ